MMCERNCSFSNEQWVRGYDDRPLTDVTADTAYTGYSRHGHRCNNLSVGSGVLDFKTDRSVKKLHEG